MAASIFTYRRAVALRHYDRAVALIDIPTTTENIALAQVQATLAVAATADRICQALELLRDDLAVK